MIVGADTTSMDRHLHLVPAGSNLVEDDDLDSVEQADLPDGNVVNLDLERARRRHHRYHPSAGSAWLDDLFEDDPLDPVC